MFGTPVVIRPNASVSVGVVGPKGSSLLGFPRLPLVTDGHDGDYYIDLTASDVRLYGPKTSGVWPSSYLSLVGPQGAPGPQILSGGGAPTQTIGNSGDYYIDTAASIFYGPKTTGQWPTPGISLIGNPGPTGPANTLTVGTVTALASGVAPTVTITGTAPNQSVSFGIPQGNPGANGAGTGTVIGPATSTMGHVPAFADATGTNLSDSGIPVGAELLPVQNPAAAASYAFGAGDLFKETRRSNGGAAMADTLPPASTVGLVNGTTIQINNVDATATLTLSPGSGTTIITAAGTVANVAISPTRATRWIYDLANTAWRPTMNSLTGALLSDVTKAVGTAATDTAYNSQDIRALYLILSGQTGADRLNGVATIADGFNDQSDVLLTSSSGQTYDATNHRYGVTPSGYSTVSTSAQAIATNGTPGNAFDGSMSTSWSSTTAATVGAPFIGQDFGAGNPQAIRQVVITPASTNNSYCPSSILIQYSDDNATYTTAVTASIGQNSSSPTTIAVPASGAHRFWRTVSNFSTGNVWEIAELAFQIASSGTGMTLQSVAFPAAPVTAPTKARVLVQVDGLSSAFTPNTDLVASVSRDGGTTFTAGTLAFVETLADGTATYETGLIDMSSTPTGSSMEWKVVTANSKNIIVSGVVLQWRP